MNIRILVIDDDEDLLFIAEQYLTVQDSDFQLVQVSTAQKALQLLDEESFDAVICDFYLGSDQLNGLQILEWLREHGSATPFIIFTGRSREEIAIQALNLGADYYLEKGDDLEGLFTEIGHHIKNVVRSRRTEDALRESEEKYRNLLENLPQRVFYKDRNSAYIAVNPAFASDFDLSIADIIGKTDYDLYPEEVADLYTSSDQKILESREPHETDQYDFEDTEKIFHIIKTPVLDDHDNVIGILGILWDITERKAAEKALRDSEGKYRLLFENLSDGLVITDVKGIITMSNPQTASIFGYASAELMGSHITAYIHPDDRDQIMNLLRESPAAKQAGPEGVEVRGVKKDGSEIICHVVNSVLMKNEGPIGYQSIIRDITDSKRAGDALKESEAKYRTLVESMLDLVFVLDRNNRYSQVYFGDSSNLVAPSEELLGRSVREILPREAAGRFEEASRVARETGKGGEFDYQQEINGSNKWFSARISLHEDGESIVATVTNITERKKIENELRIAEKEWRNTFDSIPEWVSVLNNEFEITRANKIMAESLGLEPEELIGKKCYEVIHKTSAPFPGCPHLSTLETGQPASSEIYDPAVGVPLLVTTSPICDDNGEQIGIVHIAKDISAQVKADERIRKSETKFRVLFENAGIGMAQVSMDGKILAANRRLSEILGYNVEELLNMEIPEITHPDDIAEDDRALEEMIESGASSYQIEKRYKRKDGVVVLGQLTVTMVSDEEGTPQFTIGMLEDITEHKRILKELAVNADLLSTIFEMSPVAIDVYDANGAFLRANKSCLDLFGIRDEADLERHNIFNDPNITDDQKQRMREGEILRFDGVFDFDIIKCNKIFDTSKQGKAWYETVISPLGIDIDGVPSGFILHTLDISERVIALKSLQESEGKFRRVFERAGIGMTLVGSDDRIIEANSAYQKLVGYSLDELRDLRIADFTHPDDAFLDAVLFKEIVEKKRDTYQMNKRYITKTGRITWVNLTVTVIRDETEKITHIIGMIEDISAQKTAETRFRHLFETSPIGIAIVGLSGEIYNANKALENILGYSNNELAECNVEDFTHPEDWVIEKNLEQELIDGKSDSYALEKRFHHKDGHIVWGRLRVAVKRDDNGDPEFVIGLVSDITEEKLSQQKIAQSEERFRTMAENIADGILIFEDGSLVFANDKASEIYGYTLDELSEMTAYDLVAEEERDKIIEMRRKWDEEGLATPSLNLWIERKDGSKRYVSNRYAHTSREDGRRIGIITSTDMTQAKLAEIALKMSETKFRQVVDSTPLGVHMYELNNEGDLLFIGANPAADRILGVDHSKFTGLKIEEAFPASVETEIPARYREIAESGSTWDIERIIYEDDEISGAFQVHAFQSAPNKMVAMFLDITDRKIAEHTLTMSEENLRTLFETIEDKLFIIGLDEKIITANQSVRDDLGYTKEELIGLPAVQLHPPNRRVEAAAILKEMIEGKTTHCPVPLMAKDGTILHVETKITLGKWQGEDVLFGVSRDISQRLAAERALKHQIGFLNEVIESLDHPFYVIDANDYSVKMANKAARLGNGRIGESCYVLTHHNSEPCSDVNHPCPLEEVQRTKSAVITEHIHYDEEGKPHDVEVHGHPVIDEKGKVIQMIEYSLDVTKQKSAIRALEASEHRFRDLFEKAPLGYQTLGEDSMILDVNQAWLDTTGYDKDDIVGFHFGRFLTRESQSRFTNAFSNSKESGVMRNEEFEMIAKDGRILMVRFNGRVSYDDEGQFKQIHCIFQDITDWKRADDLLKRQKEELSELAHVMSHDLGNKMKNIRNLVKIAKNKPNEDILLRVDSIAQQSAELLQASADLADAGMIVEKRVSVDLNEVVREIAKTTIPDTISFHCDDLPIVQGSPEKIGQIFQNLFTNAVEHGKPSVIEVRRAELASGTNLVVTNDGVSIPDDIRSKIFKRGFTTKERGTGLGLSIVKKLVEAHGWRVSLDPGSPTAFSITLLN
ncbi:MAG: PAS domain S-box protein [Candidatus Thorarchaeota archaeon]